MADAPHLRLVDSESRRFQSSRAYRSPVDGGVEASEFDVLERAIVDMDGWIMGLPYVSELRWSFLRAQKALVADLDERRSRARTADRQ